MGWPVIDPLARYGLARERNNEELMANHIRYFGSEDGMVEASPPHIMRSGEKVQTPPALLVQGAEERWRDSGRPNKTRGISSKASSGSSATWSKVWAMAPAKWKFLPCHIDV